jgi:hypothetical protein
MITARHRTHLRRGGVRGIAAWAGVALLAFAPHVRVQAMTFDWSELTWIPAGDGVSPAPGESSHGVESDDPGAATGSAGPDDPSAAAHARRKRIRSVWRSLTDFFVGPVYADESKIHGRTVSDCSTDDGYAERIISRTDQERGRALDRRHLSPEPRVGSSAAGSRVARDELLRRLDGISEDAV